MTTFKENDLSVWIDAAETAAQKLKQAIVAEGIYVATSEASSFIPYSHLTKAFQVHEAIVILCRAGYGSEATALSRVMLEIFITVRWITNQDQTKRADEFALFVAKRKEYVAKTFAKYQPGNPVAIDAVRFVASTYKQYADNYDSWVFWSNKPNNLRQLSEEKEMLIPGLAAPDDDAVMLYELFYSHASDHVHVTALALDEVFPPTRLTYEPVAAKLPRHVFNAIVYATQWLFYIMIRVNRYRQMGLQPEIDNIHKEFAKLF